MNPLLIILFGLIGSYLYALRGGNYFRKGKSTLVNRLIFVIPFALLSYVAVGLPLVSVELFAGCLLAVILGHGVFMDCGRWKGSTGIVKEHEKPITWLIGPEKYAWSFNKRRLHNICGMGLLGMLRHSFIIAPFYAIIDTNCSIFYILLGLTHGLAYEIGYQIGERKILNFFPDYKFTSYGEHIVGFIILSGWCYFGTGQ